MTAREAALKTLLACEKQGGWSEGTLKRVLSAGRLDAREAALATRLCFGVLQNSLLCDFYLNTYSSVRTEKMDAAVRCVLRLGAYQILFLDRIPDSAAVNESVSLIRKYARNPKLAGFVNGVLRALVREKESLPEIPGKDPVASLSIRYSHPRWLVEKLLQCFGREETEALLAANNAPVPTTVQVNTLRTSCDALVADLAKQGVEAARHPYLKNCLTISGTGRLERLESFQRGDFYVQDAAARWSVEIAGVKPGDKVLDVCSAPGGKSFAAAIAMENQGEILACDIHPHKIKLIEAGAARLGIGILQAQLRDGKKRWAPYCGIFDVVICDVPCSGLGVIRKKPDIRYKNPAPLSNLPGIQTEILENVCAYVRPGGTLLYSTCTVLPEENQAVVERFLAGHPEFAPEEFTLPVPQGASVGGCLTFLPQVHGTDGFFAAKLKRKN